MQTSSTCTSHFTVPCQENMASQHCKQSSCSQFHETDEQQGEQHTFSEVIHENELQSRQTMDALSSSLSSLSSLSTSSLFSLSDSLSQPKSYKTTGTLFGNLDPVPLDPEVDPKPYACYNCWQFDHECHNCPEVKILYCRNCGRRGVVMNECPRCARAYVDFLDRLNGQCRAFIDDVQEPEEKTKLILDVKLDVIEEEGAHEKCWDDFVEEDCKNYGADFLDSFDMKEAAYSNDIGDWNNYKSPRMNIFEKTSKVYSLFATKAEVAKFKNDNYWDDFEMDNYSYSWENHVTLDNSANPIPSEENTKYDNENWSSFSQDASKDLWLNSTVNNQFENERAEHESECWSNHNDDIKSPWYKYMEEKNTSFLIPAKRCSLEDTSGNINVTDIFSSPETNFSLDFGKQSKIDFVNKNVQCPEEDLSDVEDYKSLDTSFCEEVENDNFTTLDIDEEYWTDFDDDNESLQASFAEEYKSLDTTADDENDETNILMMDVPNSSTKLVFYGSFDASRVTQSDVLFPSIMSKKSDEYFLVEQGCEINVYEFNSLENSVADQSEESYDIDNCEDLIVDEDERSEPLLSTGHVIQEFLVLLDSVKHLPIKTQNLAVLHYISISKEVSWQSQMQSM